ncbi:MAG TPA: hypothetical protein EYP41_22485 [Anaerolineae bacterium]|nr:hypothetical protein [Anaerolineae bacterium]
MDEPNRPRFPDYNGPPMPPVLHPWNLRHYGKLLAWIFFQPGYLLHYLRRADPELYQAKGRAFWGTVRLAAYRNLYLMFLVVTIVLAVGLVWLISTIQGTPVNWLSMAIGVAIGVAFVMIFGVGFGVGLGVAFGVAVGVTGSVAIGVVFGVVFVAPFVVAGGVVAYVVAGGVAIGVAFGRMYGVAGGVAVGVAVGGVAFGVAGSVMVGVMVGGSIILGASHLLFYPFIIILNHFIHRVQSPYLAFWDQLMAIPLVGTTKRLHSALKINFTTGLQQTTQVAANPYQRWAAQRALTGYIFSQPDPLSLIYQLAHDSALDSYIYPPSSPQQFRRWPDTRQVLLAELGQQFIAVTSDSGEVTERTVWRLTKPLRFTQPTPLSQFCNLLFTLFYNEANFRNQPVADITLAKNFAPHYEGARHYPHGAEVADSFTMIATFLNIQDVAALGQAYQQVTPLQTLPQPYLRPAVIESLIALGDISREVALYQQSTSAGQQAAALNRANGGLNKLAIYIQENVLPPEQVLLQRIVESWQALIAQAQGQLGEAALQDLSPAARRTAGAERRSTIWQRPPEPFANPYIAGDPVNPPLFVGRSDIFNQVDKVWRAKANPDSIILYGHRRMGKSSILRNLDQVAAPHSLIVYADLAGETSFAASTGDLFLGLADKIYFTLQETYPDAALPQPDPTQYSRPAQAAIQFNRLLAQVRAILDQNTLILALDEFEAIDHAVADGKIGADIYQFLRTKTQEPGLTFVFGGLHTLEEMSRDYQQPFYGSYSNIRVSYLNRKAAWRLITNPTPTFNLNYEAKAVERILHESGGQPYLIQQICRDALDHLNHELFDLDKEREVRILLSDVEAVLGEGFFRRGTVYFDGVWSQTENEAQRRILQTMARRDTAWSLSELAEATQLSPEDIQEQLLWAKRHDIVQQAAGNGSAWQFWVPLMHRWIREKKL